MVKVQIAPPATPHSAQPYASAKTTELAPVDLERVSGTNVVIVTNYVTIKMLNLTGFTNAQVQMVLVDTVWPFVRRGSTRLYTNRTASYFGPDNRDIERPADDPGPARAERCRQPRAPAGGVHHTPR